MVGEPSLPGDIAELSTRVLLHALGWRGHILSSSQFLARAERSSGLADLAGAIQADAYLCGTGGMGYLQPDVFSRRGIAVLPFTIPASGVWMKGRRVSALWALARYGPKVASRHLRLAPGRGGMEAI